MLTWWVDNLQINTQYSKFNISPSEWRHAQSDTVVGNTKELYARGFKL